jgi:hypothetical protein
VVLTTTPDSSSCPGQCMWDMWWTKWHWDRLFSEFFCFPLPVFSTMVIYAHNISSGVKNIPFFGSSSKSRVSSGSIVSDYGLDDREIGVRSPAWKKDFSSTLCVQPGSGAHPASCTIGTGGPFPGGKARPGRDADHSPPSSAEVENV